MQKNGTVVMLLVVIAILLACSLSRQMMVGRREVVVVTPTSIPATPTPVPTSAPTAVPTLSTQRMSTKFICSYIEYTVTTIGPVQYHCSIFPLDDTYFDLQSGERIQLIFYIAGDHPQWTVPQIPLSFWSFEDSICYGNWNPNVALPFHGTADNVDTPALITCNNSKNIEIQALLYRVEWIWGPHHP